VRTHLSSQDEEVRTHVSFQDEEVRTHVSSQDEEVRTHVSFQDEEVRTHLSSQDEEVRTHVSFQDEEVRTQLPLPRSAGDVTVECVSSNRVGRAREVFAQRRCRGVARLLRRSGSVTPVSKRVCVFQARLNDLC